MLQKTRLDFAVCALWIVSIVGLLQAAAKAATTPSQAAAQADKLLAADLAAAKSGEAKAADTKSDRRDSANTEYVHPKTAKTVSAKTASIANGTDAAIPAAKSADDETFLRRASMDLIGQPPTPGEITSFVLDPSPDKRAKIVDRLLAKSQFGENWARYWRDVIMYRRSEDRALLGRPGADGVSHRAIQ